MKYSNDHIHTLMLHDEVVESYLKPDTPLNDLPTINEFYTGQEIFITGGSGFVGKVLIEKLLRSCPDLKVIYVLLRSKKGKTAGERLKEITEMKLFDVIRLLKPEFTKKLIPIPGDVAELKLGMSDEDRLKMKNVSIVFHSAASVRFDDSLKKAVLMNTRGTREVMEFAETLSKVKTVMHVSTTYSNVYISTVEEKVYPPAADWKKTIEVCEKVDEDQLNNFTQHYINFMPNTYVFSKNLAEQVTNDYKDKLPVILFRPSVVVGANKEPLPGWVDNFNGPMGICLASTLGISKTMYCDPKNRLDMCTVDVVCKAMIIASWKRAHESSQKLSVFNCAAGKKYQLTIEQILDIGTYGVCRELPMEHMIWQAGGGVTLNKPLNYVRLMWFQIIPAMIIDNVLRFSNKKPRLMQLQRKMYEANKALSYFVTHNWEFKNENTINLCSFIRLEDNKDFDFRDLFSWDITLLVRYSILGYRQYLLKEDNASLPRCRRNYLRIEKVNQTINLILYLVAFYYIFFKFNLIENFKTYFNLN